MPMPTWRGLRWPRGGSGAGLAPTVQFWARGGLAVTEPLQSPSGAEPPHLGIVLQPDGDVVLLVPPSFGSKPREDEIAARNLLRKARRELAKVTRGPLPTIVSAVFVAIDAVLWAWVLWESVSLYHTLTSGAAALGPFVQPLIPVAGLALRRLAGRALRGWLVDWVLKKARRRIAAALPS